jgi:hypothetical protein
MHTPKHRKSSWVVLAAGFKLQQNAEQRLICRLVFAGCVLLGSYALCIVVRQLQLQCQCQCQLPIGGL